MKLTTNMRILTAARDTNANIQIQQQLETFNKYLLDIGSNKQTELIQHKTDKYENVDKDLNTTTKLCRYGSNKKINIKSMNQH